MTAPKRRYPPANVVAQRKPCIDCTAEGITSKRKAPYPGPRCTTHHRAKRAARKSTSWEARLLAIYGITADEYWAIYDFQGGKCYICGRGRGVRKRLSVDHDHETGMIRGLLDQPCNRNVLGHLRDDIEALKRAIEYLENPPAKEAIGCRIVPSTGAPVNGSTPKLAGVKRTTTDGGEQDKSTVSSNRSTPKARKRSPGEVTTSPTARPTPGSKRPKAKPASTRASSAKTKPSTGPTTGRTPKRSGATPRAGKKKSPTAQTSTTTRRSAEAAT